MYCIERKINLAVYISQNHDTELKDVRENFSDDMNNIKHNRNIFAHALLDEDFYEEYSVDTKATVYVNYKNLKNPHVFTEESYLDAVAKVMDYSFIFANNGEHSLRKMLNI